MLDSCQSELNEIADVVLPSTTFAEKKGTVTNLERRIQLVNPVLGPKGDESDDWRSICQIASRMGNEGFGFQDADAVFDEINNIIDVYGGTSFERLRSGGLQWPCFAADMVDTPILYNDTFDEDSQARLSAMSLYDTPWH